MTEEIWTETSTTDIDVTDCPDCCGGTPPVCIEEIYPDVPDTLHVVLSNGTYTLPFDVVWDAVTTGLRWNIVWPDGIEFCPGVSFTEFIVEPPTCSVAPSMHARYKLPGTDPRDWRASVSGGIAGSFDWGGSTNDLTVVNLSPIHLEGATTGDPPPCDPGTPWTVTITAPP